MRYLPVVFMGTSSLLLQILCLRQLLTTFSGNELIIGITLAVWLLIVGLGSFVGSRITFRHSFGISFILIALISQPTVILVRIIRPIIALEYGEVIPLTATIIWTFLTMAILCFMVGVQFPLAVSYLREKAPEAYSFEAIGAFIGGVLFTFLLSGTLDTYRLSMAIAIINILVAFCLLKKKSVILLLVLPFIFYAGGTSILSSLQYKALEFVERAESRYGEIVVLKIKDQFNVYSSEKYQFSYPDPQTEEMKAHLPMSLHPSAKRILIVGGSPAVIREFLKYPVSRIDFVEIDPVLIEISKELLNANDREYLNDTRVKVLYADARRYIKSLHSSVYDLVVLNVPEPSTAHINRFYTVEFFQEARSVLNKEGALYLSLPVSYGYIGRRMQTANGSIYTSLEEVFPHIGVSSEEYGIILASKGPIEINPDTLTLQFLQKEIDTKYFRSYILEDAFSPQKTRMVRKRLGQIEELNSDLRPVSYLYNLMLWSEIHGGRWMNLVLGLGEYEILVFIGIILIFLTLFFARKKKTVFFALFTTGYCTMGFALIIILIYQAVSGYIYEMIGLLAGTFMLGGAVGAYFMRDIRKPLKWLTMFDLLIIILMISAIVFMNKELIFYIFILSAGFLGGGQFATSNLSLTGKGSSAIAGRLYAIDLAGSFLGSFLTAILMVPLTGIRNTILFLIFIKALSFVLLARYKG